MRQRDNNPSYCQCRKNDTGHKEPNSCCRWETWRPREQDKNNRKDM